MNSLRILVLSERWYPQGGGAELATRLYTQRMIEAGHEITIAVNMDAEMSGARVVRLPFGSSATKVEMTLLSAFIGRVAKKLAETHDVAYIPGKLLFLIPLLKKANPSLRIIAHLHDYQLLCPHASLYNFIYSGTCNYIWSDLTCAACTGMREFKDSGRPESVVSGAVASLTWRRLMKTSNIVDVLDSTDRFVTVSHAQSRLLSKNLGELSGKFEAKGTTLFNPVPKLEYVPPSFSKDVCIGFLGGENYMKGFDVALDLSKSLGTPAYEVLVTKTKRVGPIDGAQLLGLLSEQELAAVFKRIRVVLFVSRWEEPLPYAIVESQLRGRPVVAVDRGGAIEAIARRGFTGDLFEQSKGDFQNRLGEFVSRISEEPMSFSKEISQVSQGFFEARSRSSFERFMELLN